MLNNGTTLAARPFDLKLYGMSSEHMHYRCSDSSSILLDKCIGIFILFDHAVFDTVAVSGASKVGDRISNFPCPVERLVFRGVQPSDVSRFAEELGNTRSLQVVSSRRIELGGQCSFNESHTKNDHSQVLAIREAVPCFLEEIFRHQSPRKCQVLRRRHLRREPPETLNSLSVAGLVLSGEPLLSNVHRGRVSHFVPYNVRDDAHEQAREATLAKCRCRSRCWTASTAHFLRMGMTLGSSTRALLDSTTRCRRPGATFQRSPASVMTVTVFLL